MLLPDVRWGDRGEQPARA